MFLEGYSAQMVFAEQLIASPFQAFPQSPFSLWCFLLLPGA